MALERLRLDGKVAIITGGARGVGLGVARVLGEAGASIVLTGRTQSHLEEAASCLEAIGAGVVTAVGDVTKRADNQHVVDVALRALGRIDILVNNAGGTDGVRPFLEIDEDKFEGDFRLNVQSALQMTQLAAPHLMRSGEGSVVNISSRSAQLGSCGFTSYSVVKAALERLTCMMAKELAPKVRVNAISLGTMRTESFEQVLKISPELKEKLTSFIPLNRIGEPEDVGMAALYLCSARCYATGMVMQLDGGVDAPVR